MPWPARSHRRAQLPADWPRIRRRILTRDGYRCTHIHADTHRCHTRATQVDHITPGNDHADANLTSLCTDHHAAKSAAEGHAAARTARTKSRHPRENHPGKTNHADTYK